MMSFGNKHTTRMRAALLGNFAATWGTKSWFKAGPEAVSRPIGTFTIAGFRRDASSLCSSGVLHTNVHI
jgi:hypothetical protein